MHRGLMTLALVALGLVIAAVIWAASGGHAFILPLLLTLPFGGVVVRRRA